METDNNYGLIASAMEVIDAKGTVTSAKTDYTPEKIYCELQFRNCIPTLPFFSKDLVLKVGV